MKLRSGLDDRLDSAIDALAEGARPDAVLAAQNGAADDLRELIETATALRADALHHAQQSVVAAPRLARNAGIIRAAVQRARLRERPAQREAVPHGPWWQKRVSFASLSVPLGVVALFGAVGLTGAAAAIAVSDNLPQPIQEIASTLRVPGIGSSNPDGGAPPRHAVIPGGADAVTNGAGGIDEMLIPNNTIITLTGQVTNIRGATFDMAIGDDTWSVVVDNNTEVTGQLLDGANATVTGPVTAYKNVHADTLILSGGVATADQPSNSGGPPPTRTPAPTATPRPDRPIVTDDPDTVDEPVDDDASDIDSDEQNDGDQDDAPGNSGTAPNNDNGPNGSGATNGAGSNNRDREQGR